jgi:hypothetical protein
MNYVPRILWLLLLLTPIQSFADSALNFNNLNVTLKIFPNEDGDNLGGEIFGPGVSLNVGGGTPYSWFNNIDGFAPGSPGGGSTNIFFDSVVGKIGTQNYDELDINEADFNTVGFTFPTNGKNFSITVPASIGVIVLTGCTDSGCQTLNVYSKPGKLTLNFMYFNGLYYGTPSSFTTVPEAGTLALVGFGLGLCLVASARKPCTVMRV